MYIFSNRLVTQKYVLFFISSGPIIFCNQCFLIMNKTAMKNLETTKIYKLKPPQPAIEQLSGIEIKLVGKTPFYNAKTNEYW